MAMSVEKISEALSECETILVDYGMWPLELSEKRLNMDEHPHSVSLCHCLYMCQKAQDFLKEDRREKAMRWLCFVQGVLWTQGLLTIETAKEQNKADG